MDYIDCFSVESLRQALSSYDEFSPLREKIKDSGMSNETVSWIKSNLISNNAPPDEGLVTGYYLPKIKGSLKRSDEFPIPIYAAPTAHPTTGPTRKEIELFGALSEQELEIAWVKDRIELFFVHIQGYATLELEDGSTMMLQKAGSNELPYFPIGRTLLEQGKIPKEELSMQSIRAHLETHPDQIDSILQQNTRYIYFSLQTTGPIGSSGLPLVPFRSVATDGNYYPPHSVLYIETTIPELNSGAPKRMNPVSFFALAHDSGSAIVGKGRIDLYCGEDALLAGHLKSRAKVHLLRIR